MLSSALTACLLYTAQIYAVPPPVLWAILQVEGGQIGTISQNTNGTQDMGPMQINTIWIEDLSQLYGLSQAETHYRLINDGCFNIASGGWILRQKIQEAGGDLWRGVSWYHSRTPHLSQRYLRRIQEALERGYRHM